MEPVRRIKTYSGETGFVYQYVFVSQHRARRGWWTWGTEYLFEVSRDRKSSFLVPVFVSDEAPRAWRRLQGRELSPTEQYAAAKMRLFQAFDTMEDLESQLAMVVVDATNIEELLAPLDLA
jgi:hypothetical protein